jgi:hypothetical protein
MVNGKKVNRDDFEKDSRGIVMNYDGNIGWWEQLNGDNLRGLGGKFRTIYRVLKDEKSVINKLVQTKDSITLIISAIMFLTHTIKPN